MQSSDAVACNATKIAIANNYRHIDTAFAYKNEKEVGRSINDLIEAGSLKREEIFITTKLSNIFHDPIRVEMACRKSLSNLGLDYVDLYLMHCPTAFEYNEKEDLYPEREDGSLVFSDCDYVDTWKAMEKLVDLGLAKSIGVSNFNSEQIMRLLENCRIKPVTNQVECSATFNQKKLIEFCKARDIVVTAYSPLTKPHSYAKDPSLPKPPLLDPKVEEIGLKYGKTAGQVVLRYLIQNGVVPIPKSSNEERIKKNIDIFDFELSSEEMAILDSFNTTQRAVPFAALAGHKHFMFNAEF